MLVRRLIQYFYERLVPSVEVLARPAIVPDQIQIKLSDIFDGLLWVQKRKRNIRERWRRRYGNDNWKFGTRLWKPKNNLTTCPECGSFHEFHTVCRVCFDKIRNVVKPKQEYLVESGSKQTWFEPNVQQPKNPIANPGSTKAVNEK